MTSTYLLSLLLGLVSLHYASTLPGPDSGYGYGRRGIEVSGSGVNGRGYGSYDGHGRRGGRVSAFGGVGGGGYGPFDELGRLWCTCRQKCKTNEIALYKKCRLQPMFPWWYITCCRWLPYSYVDRYDGLAGRQGRGYGGVSKTKTTY